MSFILWALARNDADPDEDFVMRETVESPLGPDTVAFRRGDIYHRVTTESFEMVESVPGLQGWSQLYNVPDPKFPPLGFWRFEGDAAGLQQVVQDTGWLAFAAEAVGNEPLPPAWEDRTPNHAIPESVWDDLRTSIIVITPEEHRDQVTDALDDWYFDNYDTELEELVGTPAEFYVAIRNYTLRRWRIESKSVDPTLRSLRHGLLHGRIS
jgi:hypothetical protein